MCSQDGVDDRIMASGHMVAPAGRCQALLTRSSTRTPQNGSDMSTASNTTVAAKASSSRMRTIVLSSVVGTTVEWFDFFAYSTAAALILNRLFFPDYDPLVGTILAFGGIAVGYLGRPLGALVFGHFGDRIGRKRMLVASLLTMGAATFVIGLLPTYEVIGVAAPLILMVLRFVQGFALGGEWGGAVLLVVEHAEPSRRAFLGSFPQVGLAVGLTLSTLISLPLVALPGDAFETWGWRVPFLVSAVLVLVGLGCAVLVVVRHRPAKGGDRRATGGRRGCLGNRSGGCARLGCLVVVFLFVGEAKVNHGLA